MAIKSADQITIVDVTDAYSVLLTSEAYTFVGNTAGVAAGASCETEAVAYCGTNQCSVVNVNSANITCPTGITVNKKFSFAVAKAGVQGVKGDKGEKGDQGAKGEQGIQGVQGAKGDNGADAITLTITSSNGTVFKNNEGSTVLTAHVFVGGKEQTITDAGVCGSLGTVKWYKGSSASGTAAKTITVTAGEVTNSVAYTCQLEQ